MILFDLRMHRTSVDGLGCRRLWDYRFEPHTAFWAIPRFVGDHFQMHRTGVPVTRCFHCAAALLLHIHVSTTSLGRFSDLHDQLLVLYLFWRLQAPFLNAGIAIANYEPRQAKPRDSWV